MTATPEMIRQRAYRKRRTEKLSRMEAALRRIAEALTDSPTAKGQEIRTIAREALGES